MCMSSPRMALAPAQLPEAPVAPSANLSGMSDTEKRRKRASQTILTSNRGVESPMSGNKTLLGQ